MKRLYRRYKFWSFETLASAPGLLIFINVIGRMLQNPNPKTNTASLFFIAGLIAVFVIIPFLFKWLFTMRAYDDGDALVLRRRNTTARVPFTNIQRVEYVTGAGKPLRVRLHLTEPCPFGETITFPIAPVTIGPRHSEVADDIHRRSSCCRGENVHIVR